MKTIKSFGANLILLHFVLFFACTNVTAKKYMENFTFDNQFGQHFPTQFVNNTKITLKYGKHPLFESKYILGDDGYDEVPIELNGKDVLIVEIANCETNDGMISTHGTVVFEEATCTRSRCTQIPIEERLLVNADYTCVAQDPVYSSDWTKCTIYSRYTDTSVYESRNISLCEK